MKDILVSISGLQYEIDQDEAVEVISVGEYYNRNNKHYVIYEEMVENEYGQNSIAKNTIKITGNQVEIMKKGPNQMHMVFEENQKNMSYYNTPFGNLLIGIYTTKIRIKEEDNILYVQIEYGLDVNYTHVSDCNIKIKVTSKAS
jgi:uncharacterized beta-barrel protein YwiB (DUF1934 family)